MAFERAAFLFVASLILAIVVPARCVLELRTWRRYIGNPLKFCDHDCIDEVLYDHCESIPCSLQPTTPENLKKLCVDTCVRGIASRQMKRCLRRSFSKLKNRPAGFQNLLLHDIHHECDGYVVKFEANGTAVTIPFDEVHTLVQLD